MHAPNSPFTPPEAGVRTTSDAGRTALHRAVGLFTWLLVLVAWVLAATRLPWASVAEPALLVLALTLVGLAITRLWITHNVRIFEAKGPRKRPPVAPPDWRRDYLRRIVAGPLEAARFAPYVEVSYNWQRKWYRPAAMTELGAENLLRDVTLPDSASRSTWLAESPHVVTPDAIRGHGAEEEEALEDPEMTRGVPLVARPLDQGTWREGRTLP